METQARIEELVAERETLYTISDDLREIEMNETAMVYEVMAIEITAEIDLLRKSLDDTDLGDLTDFFL